MILEIVAGMIGKGKSPSDADKRECLEEARDKAKKLTSIYSYYLYPGFFESYYHSYLAAIDAFKVERLPG